jgi:hypothetical protein
VPVIGKHSKLIPGRLEFVSKEIPMLNEGVVNSIEWLSSQSSSCTFFKKKYNYSLNLFMRCSSNLQKQILREIK